MSEHDNGHGTMVAERGWVEPTKLEATKLDPEVAAMAVIASTLGEIEDDAVRDRVVAWVGSRWAPQPKGNKR